MKELTILSPSAGPLKGYGVELKKIEISNEFATEQIETDHIMVDIETGKFSFTSPYGWFREFMQKTEINSMGGMKDANYIIHAYYIDNDKRKYRLAFEGSELLACNNYGKDEGHHILLQAKETISIEGWIENEARWQKARDIYSS